MISDALAGRRRRVLAVGLGVAAALTLSACSSSGSGKSNTGANSGSNTGTTAGAGSGSASGSKSDALPSGDIKLGAILSLSGPYAQYGKGIQGDLQVAVEEVNAKGGVAGHKISLDVQNDQGNPSTAVQIAQKFVSQKVVGISYAGFPNVYTQTVPIFMKAHIPVFQIDPTGTIAGMGGAAKFPYYFNNYANPAGIGDAAARAVPTGSKAALIGDGTPNAVGLTNAFLAAAPKHGVTVVKKVVYSQTALDVTSQLREAKNSGATALVVLTGTGYAKIWDGLRAIGWTPNISTSSGALSDGADSIKNLAAKIVYACAPVTLPANTQPDASLGTYLTDIEKKVGGPAATHGTAPSVGDSIFAFAAAIGQAHSTSGDALKSAFETWKDKSLVSTFMTYTFTSTDHDGVAPSEVSVCSMGKPGPHGLPVRTSSS